MNIRYLEILEAVGQTGSFTGAAKKLHLTQSAISHAMADLEQQSGTALFERLPRGVCLTPCGEVLKNEAAGILASCRSLERRLGHLEEYAPVTIVSSITAATFLLPQIIGKVKERLPQLQINVRVVSAARAMEILQQAQADIAFVEGARPQGAFVTVLLGSYRLRAACAPSFVLPGKRLSAQELCSLPLLLREPGSAVRETFDSMLSLSEQKAYPTWESVNSHALVKAAEAGFGITVLPDVLLADSFARGTLRPVETAGLEMENAVQAVLRKDKYITQSLRAVLDALPAQPEPYFKEKKSSEPKR